CEGQRSAPTQQDARARHRTANLMENVLTPGEQARPDAAREATSAELRPKQPKRTEPKAVARADAPAKADPGAAPEVSVIVPITVGNARARDVVTALGSELDRP